MNAMPIDVARQLVNDRRTSYETAAGRRRIRRFLARRPPYSNGAAAHIVLPSTAPSAPGPVDAPPARVAAGRKVA